MKKKRLTLVSSPIRPISLFLVGLEGVVDPVVGNRGREPRPSPKPILNIRQPGPSFPFLERGDYSFIDVPRHAKRRQNLDPAIAEDPAVENGASFPVFSGNVDVGALSSLFVADRSSLVARSPDREQRPDTLIRWSLPRRCSGFLLGRIRRAQPPGPPYRFVIGWEATFSQPPPRNRKRVNWRETVPGVPQETLPENPS